MFDIEIQRCTRRCAVTGEELAAGAEFYSVLVPDGAEILRHDFSAPAWTEPPENAIACWEVADARPGRQPAALGTE